MAQTRQVLSTAKLVVTFFCCGRGDVRLCRNAEQRQGLVVRDVGGIYCFSDLLSRICFSDLLLVLLITLRVLLERKSELEPENVKGQSPGLVQAALLAAALADKEVAQSAHGLMVWQVRFSLASSVVAAIGLFIGRST